MDRNRDDDRLEFTMSGDDGSLDNAQAEGSLPATEDESENEARVSTKKNHQEKQCSDPSLQSDKSWDRPCIQNMDTKSFSQRIEKIQEKLRASSLSITSRAQQHMGLRSKSMPIKSQQKREEIMNEPSIESTSTTEFHETHFKSTTSSSRPFAVSPATTQENNESTICASTPLDASRSFQSFSTMHSDAKTDQSLFSNNNNHRCDDTEPLSASRSSQRSTITSVLAENSVFQTPSFNQETRADDKELLDYVVDEQRAKVVEKLRGAAFKRRMDVSPETL
jgi:hypothetical protein